MIDFIAPGIVPANIKLNDDGIVGGIAVFKADIGYGKVVGKSPAGKKEKKENGDENESNMTIKFSIFTCHS